jgi:hypothetical protein
MRRTLLAAVVLAAAGGATALAQTGTDPYQLPEPPVTAKQVIKLPGAAKCVRAKRVKVRFTPPLGAVFAVLTIDVRGEEVVRLTGVPRAASATVAIPKGRSRVRVDGTTLGGQEIASARTYRTCGARKTPRPRPNEGPLQEGGGED